VSSCPFDAAFSGDELYVASWDIEQRKLKLSSQTVLFVDALIKVAHDGTLIVVVWSKFRGLLGILTPTHTLNLAPLTKSRGLEVWHGSRSFNMSAAQ
jgi:hypothetical protein